MNIGKVKIQDEFLGTWYKGHRACLHIREASEKRLGIDGRGAAYVAIYTPDDVDSIPKWSQRIEFIFPTEYTWEELKRNNNTIMRASVKEWPCKVVYINHKGTEKIMEAEIDLQFGDWYN